MSNVKVTLAIGIALIIAGGVLVLTQSPPRVARINGSGQLDSLGVTQGELSICQANEVLPANVSAIRVSLVAFLGAKLQAAIYHNGRIITEGSRNPDWSGTSPTIPVKPLAQATSHVELCVAFAPNSQLIQIFGLAVPAENAAAVAFQNPALSRHPPAGLSTLLRGKLQVTYLAAGRRSWWSRALSVATHMGLGHFIGGKWVALLAALLMATVTVLTVRLTLREQP
jgi:hypothetical protein